MNLLHRSLLTSIAFAGLSFSVPAVHAQNLVQDGGFETAPSRFYNAGDSLGDGFTVTRGIVAVDSGVFSAPYDGNQELDLTSGITGPNTVSQTLTTTIPGNYTFSFYAANDTRLDSLTATLGSSTFALQIPSYGVLSASDYSFFSFTVPVTTATTVLTLSGTFNDPNQRNVGIVVDDVSVTANSAPVPEASTTVSFGLLLALGMGGMVLAAKKKKATSQAV